MKVKIDEQVVQLFPRRCPYCDQPVSCEQVDVREGETPIECPSCRRIFIRVGLNSSLEDGKRSMERPLTQSPRDSLTIPIQYVKGIGPKLAGLFEKKGVRTVGDALYFLPRIYEDRTTLKKISELGAGGTETGMGEVLLSGATFFRNRRRGFKAVVGDESGSIVLRWFQANERYLKEQFKKGRPLIFSGDVTWFNGQKQMVHPDVEWVDEDPETDSLHLKRIVPIYSETEGLHQRTLRRLMKRIVDEFAHEISSPLPPEILDRQGLIDVREAFSMVHFPPEGSSVETLNLHRSAGHRRIIFDEFFYLELGLAIRKRGVSTEDGTPFQAKGTLVQKLLNHLSFRLTGAQERVHAEVVADMAKPHPMNRLIQGDVGSGKTVVAVLACLHVIECGYQAAFMAPTELLAEQHHDTLRRWLAPLGIEVALLTSRIKGAERERIQARVREGRIHLLVGTHAMIQESVTFKQLGLAVIDEQHKFGVIQRGLLKKKGENPDLLVMTATPIPRTLAMTVYGDLDVSVVDEMPPGRMPVKTRVFPESARQRVYRLLEEEIKKGRQAFIVYPLVEESEKLDLKDATRMAEHLQKDIFPGVRVGLLHGRMGNDEKEAIMAEFKDGRIQLLVSTTVIEVGIDISNASVMVVEHAERFGLSQLHQLRGRIGRGRHPSMCILLAQYRASKEARTRLRAMEKTTDGFQLAEEDLVLRGPGEFFGTRQSGLPDFRVAHLMRDTLILSEARKEAFHLVEKDPDLNHPSHAGLKDELITRWGGRLELATIG